MNPFLNLTNAQINKPQTKITLPVFKEYAFDFEKNEFKKNEVNQHIVVEKNEALKVWIYKTLKTERYRFLVYGSAYGVELEQFINKPNLEATGQVMKRFIKEALEVNPYIVKVNRIEIIKHVKDIITLEIYLTSVYGDLLQEVRL